MLQILLYFVFGALLSGRNWLKMRYFQAFTAPFSVLQLQHSIHETEVKNKFSYRMLTYY